MVRVLERAFRELAAQFAGSIGFTLAEQRVELEQQRIDDFVVGLRQIQGLVAERECLFEITKRMHVHLGRVQHGFEVGVV